MQSRGLFVCFLLKITEWVAKRCATYHTKRWMSTNQEYSFWFLACIFWFKIMWDKYTLFIITVNIYNIGFFFLGREKTKGPWTEYSICPGDWQNPPLNPRVPFCYRQTADSLHCRQSWCSTGPSGSTGKLYTGWTDVLTGFLSQPKRVWLSLSLILIMRICNMISVKVQVNFR